MKIIFQFYFYVWEAVAFFFLLKILPFGYTRQIMMYMSEALELISYFILSQA